MTDMTAEAGARRKVLEEAAQVAEKFVEELPVYEVYEDVFQDAKKIAFTIRALMDNPMTDIEKLPDQIDPTEVNAGLHAENKRLLNLLQKIYAADNEGDIDLSAELYCDLYDLLHVKARKALK